MFDPEWSDNKVIEYLRQLNCWHGPINVEPLVGGLCNRSFVVTDDKEPRVARIGTDILVHGIIQSSVQASMIAAAEIGISPRIRHSEPGLAIVDFVHGGCLRMEDINDEGNLEQIVVALKKLHSGSNRLRGTVTYFWPFQVIRNYIGVGKDKQSRLIDEFEEVNRINSLIEQSIEPYTPCFTHNDTVPQNFMFGDEGKIWVIDWDYGGFGHPMFDLVGVSCNADMELETEAKLFEMYFGEMDELTTRQLIAFKLALNLREYMWGMVQEVTSDLDDENVAASMTELYPDQDPGYTGYTNMNRIRFEANWQSYQHVFE